MGMVSDTPEQLPCDIKDNWSQITITNIIVIITFGNLLRITKMGHKDIKWTNAVGKMALIETLGTGLPQPSICKKYNIWEAQ